jgi:hypothetical protein
MEVKGNIERQKTNKDTVRKARTAQERKKINGGDDRELNKN